MNCCYCCPRDKPGFAAITKENESPISQWPEEQMSVSLSPAGLQELGRLLTPCEAQANGCSSQPVLPQPPTEGRLPAIMSWRLSLPARQDTPPTLLMFIGQSKSKATSHFTGSGEVRSTGGLEGGGQAHLCPVMGPNDYHRYFILELELVHPDMNWVKKLGLSCNGREDHYVTFYSELCICAPKIWEEEMLSYKINKDQDTFFETYTQLLGTLYVCYIYKIY